VSLIFQSFLIVSKHLSEHSDDQCLDIHVHLSVFSYCFWSRVLHHFRMETLETPSLSVFSDCFDREDTFVYILFRHYEHCAFQSFLIVSPHISSTTT